MSKKNKENKNNNNSNNQNKNNERQNNNNKYQIKETIRISFWLSLYLLFSRKY